MLAVPVQARVRAGLLTCNVAPGVGVMVGSQKAVSCTFKSVQGWSKHYKGCMTRAGLSIGYTKGGVIAWAVYAPALREHSALAGS